MAQLLAPFVTGVVLNESKKYFSMEISWSIVFAISGIDFLLSAFFILFVNIKPKEKQLDEAINQQEEEMSTINQHHVDTLDYEEED
jgi:cytoskeletal protein RodZ